MILVNETFSKPCRLKSLRALFTILFLIAARCPCGYAMAQLRSGNQLSPPSVSFPQNMFLNIFLSPVFLQISSDPSGRRIHGGSNRFWHYAAQRHCIGCNALGL